jgi:Spy/CpxP family protein refolding chaperone
MMKLFQVLPGAVALTLAFAPMVPVVAQSGPQPGVTNQTKPYRGPKLNLSDEQKAQMKEIRESTRAKIDAVLTNEQKAKIRAIRQEARKEMDAVLTPEQRAQLQQQRQMRQQMQQQQGTGTQSGM